MSYCRLLIYFGVFVVGFNEDLTLTALTNTLAHDISLTFLSVLLTNDAKHHTSEFIRRPCDNLKKTYKLILR